MKGDEEEEELQGAVCRSNHHCTVCFNNLESETDIIHYMNS